MAQALPKLYTFEELIEWLPENTGKRYELHDGIIVEMTVLHSPYRDGV